MDNGVNNSVEQTIPGVKVAPPNAAPIDAGKGDVGATNSGVASTITSSVVQNSVSSSIPVQNVMSNQVAPALQPTVVDQDVQNANGNEKKKKKNKGVRFLLFVILLLFGAGAYMWYYHQQEMARMIEKCTPVSTTDEAKKLDLNSTIVRDLYSKVYTNIREDLAQSELNDELKLYLAYRQIPVSSFYDSNCNLFTTAGIEPFVCEETASFTPKAFKKETLQLEVKKLFGEDVNISDQNIQLGNSCAGGYQYIAERGEYVQGLCKTNAANMYRADKKLIGATSRESVIVLKESVKYYGSEGVGLPARLSSGVYEYTFKLDVNYNYVYVSKTLAVE